MVVYILYVKAELEGSRIASVNIPSGRDICLSVRNPLVMEEVREHVVIDSRALEEKPNKKHHNNSHQEAPCHFALTWSGHDERSTIRVLWNTNDETNEKSKRSARTTTTRAMTLQDSGTFVPMLALECHGMEPYAFHPDEAFQVTETDGTVHETVDFSQNGQWEHYDWAKGNIVIRNLETKFV